MSRLALCAEQLWFAIRTIAALVLVELGLRTMSLPRLCERLGLRLRLEHAAQRIAAVGEPVGPELTWWDVERVARRVRKINRFWPFGDTCLRQSLVTGAFLRPIQPVLVIGVRRREGVLQAHAWLKVAGRDIDPEAGTYSSFAFN